MNDHVVRALLEKGVLTASDLSGGATLNPQQREALADLTINSMKLNEHATVEKVYDIWEHDGFELSGRYAELDNGTESSGRKPATQKVTYTPIPLKAVLPLHKTYLRRLATQRLTEEQKAEALSAALGVALGKDTEKMAYYSNTLGPSIKEADYKNDGTGHATNRIKDVTFSQANGIIAQADASGSGIQTYDAANGTDIKLILHELIRKLPADYREDKTDLRFYVPSNVEENLRSQLSKRATQYGDLILTKDDEIKFRGILVVSLPLLETNPYVTEHITMNGTTARALLYKPIPSTSTFFANAAALSSTATAPGNVGASGTDIVLNITNGTVAIPASPGNFGNTDVVKYTYAVLPQIFLTKKSNFLIAVGVNDMEQESQYFANKGVLELVGRTRIAWNFIKQSWVARAINVQDAVLAS